MFSKYPQVQTNTSLSAHLKDNDNTKSRRSQSKLILRQACTSPSVLQFSHGYWCYTAYKGSYPFQSDYRMELLHFHT